jgi:hypothetical protein
VTQLSKVTRFLSAAEETFWVKQLKERERERERKIETFRVEESSKKKRETFWVEKIEQERERNKHFGLKY